jgi:hypothetical protein
MKILRHMAILLVILAVASICMPIVTAINSPCKYIGYVSYNGNQQSGITVTLSWGDSTVSGTGGKYSIDSVQGIGTITASYNGRSITKSFDTATTNDIYKQIDLNIPLSSPSTITGIVTYKGIGISAAVSVPGSDPVITGSDGSYSIVNLGNGQSYTVSASYDTGHGIVTGTASVTTNTNGGTVSAPTIALNPKSTTVSGIATYNGNARGGITVEARSGDTIVGSATTDGSGSYSIS